MEVQRDFKELLVLLNEHKVEYLPEENETLRTWKRWERSNIGGIYSLHPQRSRD
jgi:hypothetical protein